MESNGNAITNMGMALKLRPSIVHGKSHHQNQMDQIADKINKSKMEELRL